MQLILIRAIRYHPHREYVRRHSERRRGGAGGIDRMLPSASLGDRHGLYEPVGTARPRTSRPEPGQPAGRHRGRWRRCWSIRSDSRKKRRPFLRGHRKGAPISAASPPICARRGHGQHQPGRRRHFGVSMNQARTIVEKVWGAQWWRKTRAPRRCCTSTCTWSTRSPRRRRSTACAGAAEGAAARAHTGHHRPQRAHHRPRAAIGHEKIRQQIAQLERNCEEFGVTCYGSRASGRGSYT